MKKLFAVILTMTILATSSAVILADNGKSKNASSVGTSGQVQTVLQSSIENAGKGQQTFEEQKKKVEEKKAQIEAKKALFKTKKAEYAAYKDLLSVKRDEMIALRKTGNLLHAESAKLQGDLKSSLESIKEKGIVLPEATMLALNTCMAQIKELMVKIKETQGQIHSILTENKGFIHSKDYVSMEVAFDEIYAVEQFRNTSLTQINTLLKDMIKLLVTVV